MPCFPPRDGTVLQALGAAALVAGCGEYRARARRRARRSHFAGPTMGTRYTVKIAGAALTPEREAAARGPRSRRRSTGVVRGCRRYDAGVGAVALQPARRRPPPSRCRRTRCAVFALARQVSAAIRAARSTSPIAPLVDAWGFGPARHAASRPPSDVARAAARRRLTGRSPSTAAPGRRPRRMPAVCAPTSPASPRATASTGGARARGARHRRLHGRGRRRGPHAREQRRRAGRGRSRSSVPTRCRSARTSSCRCPG